VARHRVTKYAAPFGPWRRPPPHLDLHLAPSIGSGAPRERRHLSCSFGHFAGSGTPATRGMVHRLRASPSGVA
jgi:hypothetical protein